MSNYIYMTEDTPKTIATEHYIFKAGYSKHPQLRGGQMRQAARRAGIAGDVEMKIEHHAINLYTEDKALTHFVEGYVLGKISSLPSVERFSREFFFISWKDREYCYQHLQEWVDEAMRLWGEG
jgi:hypothetical protein